MLVGEIGITRHEFLYEIDFWEVRRIIRGYRRRDKLKNQLIAECVYAAMYAMRDPKGKTVTDMFPMLFADDSEEENEGLTKEEADSLQADIDAFNRAAKRKKKRKARP